MKPREFVDEYADTNGVKMMVMDGFDECIVGIVERSGESPFVLYDREKVIETLMAQGMTRDEAEEHHGFNQTGAYVGEGTPGFLLRE